jgi:hypothetical protein
MGTRGYLIFKYQGRYYIIYNHWDSYVSCMGVEIVKQIIALIKIFGGSAVAAKEYWRSLFAKLTFTSEKDGNKRDNPINTRAFKDIEASLMMHEAEIFLWKPITEENPTSDGLMIEYLWEIDLDDGQVGM